ncbi:hypothetical protein A4A49_21329 [Nicotiana attenuata]|uniref:Uncharacterized protein n=1 Tax=Nicotiana attenuata TaxID=49451 RepID=A0A1J6IE12_NICAT|nr:hypothetical protein A4A49_21329 [Nicotiana attenuata]
MDRKILAFSVLTILVCSLLVNAQDQKNNAVTSQNPTPKVVSGTKDAGEVNHEDDDAGIDSLNRSFYENEEFGPAIFVAGH